MAAVMAKVEAKMEAEPSAAVRTEMPVPKTQRRRISAQEHQWELLESRRRVHNKIRGIAEPVRAGAAQESSGAGAGPYSDGGDDVNGSAEQLQEPRRMRTPQSSQKNVLLLSAGKGGAGPIPIPLLGDIRVSGDDDGRFLWGWSALWHVEENRSAVLVVLRIVLLQAVLLVASAHHSQSVTRIVHVSLSDAGNVTAVSSAAGGDAPTVSASFDEQVCVVRADPAWEVLLLAYNSVLMLYTFALQGLATRTRLLPGSRDVHAVCAIALAGLVIVVHTTFGMRDGGRSASGVYTVTDLPVVQTGSSASVTAGLAKERDDFVVIGVTTLLAGAVVLHLCAGPRLRELICYDYDTVHALRRMRHELVMRDKIMSDFTASDFIIAYESLDIVQTLGGNSVSEVLKGKYRHAAVAIKRLARNVTEAQMRAFGQEVCTMAELRHPNVVLMMGFCVSPPAIVTEFLARGSLFKILHVRQPTIELDWTMVFLMLVDMTCGMGFLHAQNPPVVHSDLKTPNVLVDMSWRCKVADLGLGRLKQELQRNPGFRMRRGSTSLGVGSPLWCAPEVFTQQRLSPQSDVFAFGIVLFEMLFRTLPYSCPQVAPIALPLKVVEGTRPSPVPAHAERAKRQLGAAFAQLEALMQACWHRDPQRRPPFNHILPQLEMIATSYTGDEHWERRVVFPAGEHRASGRASDAGSTAATVRGAARSRAPTPSSSRRTSGLQEGATTPVRADAAFSTSKAGELDGKRTPQEQAGEAQPVGETPVSPSQHQLAVAAVMAALAEQEERITSGELLPWMLEPAHLELGPKRLMSTRALPIATHDGTYAGEPVQVQPLYLSDVRASAEAVTAFMEAARTLCRSPHPHLVRTLGIATGHVRSAATRTPRQLMLVTDHMSDSSLWETYHARTRPALHEHWLMALGLAIDVSSAMAHLHGLGLAHGQLRSPSITINAEGEALVGELVIHELLTNDPLGVLGNPIWCAPEVRLSPA
eukprot:g7469.t1